MRSLFTPLILRGMFKATHLDLPLPQTSRPLSSAILHFMELTVYRANSNKQITWNMESVPPGTAAPSGALHRGKRTTWGRNHVEPAPGVDLRLQGWSPRGLRLQGWI